MVNRFRKIFVFALTFVMLLNYSAQIFPVKVKNHCAESCQCTDNCGCGCKGKVSINFVNFVCIDSVGCSCSKGKQIPNFPIKEGIIPAYKILMPLYPGEFFTLLEDLTEFITEFDILHPPENFICLNF